MNTGVYIVTGGTHGIGRACVETLAGKRHSVLFTGRDKTAGAALEGEYQNVTFAACDAADPKQCEQAVELAFTIGNGKICGLVNNAGMSLRSEFHQTSTEDWDRAFDVNTRSAYLFTRLSMPGLVSARGSVVMMSSVAGKVGQAGLAIYTASKASLIGLTQALALEYGADVRFNAICPGQIATRMMQKLIDDPARLAATVSAIPCARLGMPQEVADVVCWLLSDASSFVNGAIIPVDGGESAGIKDIS